MCVALHSLIITIVLIEPQCAVHYPGMGIFLKGCATSAPIVLIMLRYATDYATHYAAHYATPYTADVRHHCIIAFAKPNCLLY